MRTVRRVTLSLNPGKRQRLEALREAYAGEKAHWLGVFACRQYRPLLKRHRQVRDEFVGRGYGSARGLPGRLWKLALVEAAETWDKHWQALFVQVRSRIARHRDWSEDQRHYAYWLLKGYDAFFACLEGQAPVFAKPLEEGQRRSVARWVRRTANRLKGRAPTVRHQRSLTLDANCYSVFEQDGVQYLKVMTLERGQRLVIPLKGKTPIGGNLRLVVDRDRVEVHVCQQLRPGRPDPERVEAVDFGYSEAFTDTQGVAYGANLGRLISQASNARHHSGRARGKLHALAERHAHSPGTAHRRKARHIRRHNLGRQKGQRREDKARAAIACEINQGLNRLLRTRRPGVLVSEDLRHAFTFNKPPSWNRRLSAWTRGLLQDRVVFKGLAEGFRHEAVNPAYGSQTCPPCGYVDRDNRNGDRFLCLHCGYADHADRVAALNYLQRRDDRQITRYTPYREVKIVLLERFHRRLEAEGASPPPATVPGRTPETAPACATTAGDAPRARAGRQLRLPL